uniref:calcium-responsive transcription factor-like isoform X3 n=1 Tax=Monopterus albus TaxID=43700 RepID=UPI0009B41C5E|nr:calcium-responsive transcription factor-like isoform X3 [Monopterus albus]
METFADGNHDVRRPEPNQSADPGSELLLGSASSLASSQTGASLSPAPPSDRSHPTSSASASTETNAPPATGPTPSKLSADSWMTSQLLATPPVLCQSQVIIVESGGQTVPCEHMVIVAGQSEGREAFVIPSSQDSGSSNSPAGPVVDIPVTTVTDYNSTSSMLLAEPAAAVSSLDASACMKALPSSTPSWALRLHSAQKLGDSYRGFCCSETELEAILLLHKQQTGCVFGTRQSPSVDKPATRLMWKSQYIPYDGIPFINTGSRAIVMECQFGPRRKGLQPRKSSELSAEVTFRATCPARIYIKKVRKFPEFKVPTEPEADRKTVRLEQEKAFQCLKTQNLETGGVIRFYLQLPTEKAHLYHTEDLPPIPPPPADLTPPTTQPEEEEEMMEELVEQVAERIKQLVAAGHHQVYTIRKQLRRFVEKELFKCDGLPDRHNLRFFPTINDIRNHIHESQKALGLTADTTEWSEDSTDPQMETVTLTLTPAAEVLDGSDTLPPEAFQLFSSLSSLQPRIFAQLQGILLPPPPLFPSSILQIPEVEASGSLGSEEELGEGQQVVLHNIDHRAALVGASVLQVEAKEEEEEEVKKKKKKLEDSTFTLNQQH